MGRHSGGTKSRVGGGGCLKHYWEEKRMQRKQGVKWGRYPPGCGREGAKEMSWGKWGCQSSGKGGEKGGELAMEGGRVATGKGRELGMLLNQFLTKLLDIECNRI